MVVYKITNSCNGKIYIGATCAKIQRRFRQHLNLNNNKKRRTILSKAISKYGFENFKIEVIEECSSSKEMFEKEVFWIAFYNSMDIKVGYNMIPGGESGPIMRGKDHPNFGKKSTNPNWLTMNKGRKLSKEHNDSFQEANKKWARPPEYKKKLSEALIRNQKAGKYDNIGSKISAIKKGRTSKKRTLVICLNNNKVYDSYGDAAQALGVSQGNIPQVVKGKYSHTKGFNFQKVTADHLIF